MSTLRATMSCRHFTFTMLICCLALSTYSFRGLAAQEIPNEGMIGWWNASSINASRRALQQKPLGSGDLLDIWSDESQAGRTLVQPIGDRRPKLVQVGEDWVVRFDGQDDCIQNLTVPGTAKSLTIFLVAAPHENLGDYRAFLSAGTVAGRDYETGLNLDMGPAASAKLEQLNVEGAGFSGARDLLDHEIPFGNLSQMVCVVDQKRELVELSVDGQKVGTREFKPTTIELEHLTLGARLIADRPTPLLGYLKGDIAELIIYDRVLEDSEMLAVQSYLKDKHKRLAASLPKQLNLADNLKPLVKAENPPAIQMLVPGFRVRELPVSLTNVNNVRFREDGKLVTLGYNGDLHLLSDTNGDGLEDHAEVFWKNEGSLRGPIGLELTPAGYERGKGVFVPSKGKVSLIVDTDGDDVADEEIVIASGWEEIPQNVDAVGIALDKDGAIYFGLGTANYANAYLVDENGKAQYDLNSERGTVQRISPDFKKRETVCTGIRFPIAFAFDRYGELFCTEQEGATWLANGNPFDELLHIRRGNHYGFPPRHPQHNPNVIDEPSTFDYGPQHQSTCGMVFNKSINGGPVFGPSWWEHDAIVCGESRGKVWRTSLVRTEAGYVASSQLIACLQMLTIDACVAPNGDLVVACHSGPPDWGTGPAGIGKLYRIEMIEPEVARPVATWAESPHEIRIAFDQPLSPQMLSNAVDQVRVEYGEYVQAGDKFETLVPPYEVVRRQGLAPRYELPVAGVSLSRDQRTLIVNTAAMSNRYRYAVSIPLADNRVDAESLANTEDQLAQHQEIDVDFSLTGVQAEFIAAMDDRSPDSKTEKLSVWLPHLNPMVSKQLLIGSASHETFFESLRSPGELSFETRLDLSDVLRPKVQPGSTLDYEWPDEEVTVVLTSTSSFKVQSPQVENVTIAKVDSLYQAELRLGGDSEKLLDFAIQLHTTGDSQPQLDVVVFTSEDPTRRPLPLRRFLLPWSKDIDEPAVEEPTRIAEIEGGNWGLGRQLFHSDAVGCFKCHGIHGDGGTIGPDLANLVHRDYQSVMRDIQKPSFAINPDYTNQTVVLDDGQVLTGVLITKNNQLLLGDSKGDVTRINPNEIEAISPAGVSAMPDGLVEKLSSEQMKDLMTYLLTAPPSMPLDGPLEAPPLRTPAEVAAVLADSEEVPEQLQPLKITLVSGPKDHGPGEHDYPAFQLQWGQLLAGAKNVEVDQAWEFPTDKQLVESDVLIFFQKGAWNDERAEKLDAWQRRGGGAVYIHWAVNGDDRADDFAQRIGMASRGGSISYRHGPLTLNMHSTDHPIMRNLEKMELYDESYWKLSGERKNITLLASSVEDGEARPQVWVYQRGEGRVFVSIPGHYSWTFDDPLFRVFLLRGIAWAANQPVDRFNELVPLGARMSR